MPAVLIWKMISTDRNEGSAGYHFESFVNSNMVPNQASNSMKVIDTCAQYASNISDLIIGLFIETSHGIF